MDWQIKCANFSRNKKSALLETQSASLKIYKSSAGSGKTYQLVLNYLSLILKSPQPDKFKRILAITFTNKASKEMKERVLEGLKKLKEGKDMKFIQDYEKSTGIPAHELSIKADTLLTNILHHYSHLNILTIDKFVHRIIRSFSRELGLTTSFELTFDFDLIAARCIDEVLQELGNDKHLTKILVAYYKQLIDQEDNPNIERALTDRAKILSKEEAIKKLAYYKDKDLSFFEEVRKDIRKKIKNLRQTVNSNNQFLREVLGEELGNLKNGRSKAFDSILKGWDGLDIPKPYTDSQLTKVQNGEWLSKSAEKQHPELVSLLATHGTEVQKRLLEVNEIILSINFLKSLDKNLMSFALLNDVQQQIERFKKDNNIVLIGELNRIISDIVGKESAPYIYEKIGARFENYFVDEFQDTSELQWQNLVPLIHDSLSSGHENLIVGDAKQSIYRWRGGNAQQFIDLPVVNFDMIDIQDVNQSFLNSHEGYELVDNYRSSNAVISFNNWFFPKLSDHLNSPLVSSIYKDTLQNPKRAEAGYVEVTVLKRNSDYNKEAPYDENLLRQIQECIEDGYSYHDLCILVRKNKHGTEIAQFLLDHNLPVSSQESLILSESKQVKLIHAFLKTLYRPTEENILRLFSLFEKESLISLFEKYRIPDNKNDFYNEGYEFDRFLLNALPDFDKDFFAQLSVYDQVDYLVKTLGISREDLYIDKLMNAVYDFQQRFGHQTRRFIEYLESKIMQSSVVPPDHTNAITIMTIHKSKGLQFPVVIIPKKIESDNTDPLWLSGNLISELGLSEINMKAGKDVPDSTIQETQIVHDELSTLDLLNLIYVAYTRAEDRMYIHLVEHNSKEIVKSQIRLIETHPDFDETTTTLRLGNKTAYHTEEIKSSGQSLQITTKNTVNWRDALILAVPSGIEDTEDSYTDRNWGIAIHEILQQIERLDDCMKSVDHYLKKHKKWELHEEQIRNVFSLFVQHSEVQSIFSNSITVHSERSLATSYGEVLRPDKVIEKEHEVVVIDFKTGSALPKHKDQILKYGHLLEQVYKKRFTLHLIYLSADKITVLNV